VYLSVSEWVQLVNHHLKWMLLDPTRETTERWPLLIVETEANWNSRSTYERVPSSVDSVGSVCKNKRICPALSALVGPVQNIFFLPVHFFTIFVLTAQASWTDSRAALPIA
jgi:hypothetical protein